MASLTAAAQTPPPKPPTYTTESVARVPHCEKGWHLERWYEREFPDVGNIVSGYVPVFFIGNHDFTDSKEHPPMCFKDRPVFKK